MASGWVMRMLTVKEQLCNIDRHICASLTKSTPEEVGYLSQDILGSLRNLVEACIVGLAQGDCSVEFVYPAIDPAKKRLSGTPEYKFLLTFHERLQGSVSHYTLSEDASERLMLRYVEYLYKLRKLMKEKLEFTMLGWLESFPTADPSQLEYQQAIAGAVDYYGATVYQSLEHDRYYVWRRVPFFCRGNVYYEVTLVPARDQPTNTDRFTVFTSHELPRYYAIKVAVCPAQVSVYNSILPIQVVTDWRVSLRPCELGRLASILGIEAFKPSSSSSGYRALMQLLQYSKSSLRELACLDERLFENTVAYLRGNGGIDEARLLGELRQVLEGGGSGHNVVAYLSHYVRNGVLKGQYSDERCSKLGGLRLGYGAIPFDNMPLCTSLIGHNPAISDVVSCVGMVGHEHELLAAYLKNRASVDGVIFTDRGDLPFENIDELIARYNAALYPGHKEEREIRSIESCLYISGYANDAISVLSTLGARVGAGVPDYVHDVDSFLSSFPSTSKYNDEKKSILRKLFSRSSVALVYGSAGTGKSTFVSLVADFMQGRNLLFLAWTHAAVENLERRVGADAGDFMTVTSALRKAHPTYDLVVVDECSTIPNADMKKLLDRISCNRLLLVGDDCQIGSITFGNWFELAKKSGLKRVSHDLTTTYRTDDVTLLKLWGMVRGYDVMLEEYLSKHGFSARLGGELFTRDSVDQVTLCLSYNGLYGVNNVNRILQQANPNPEVEWGRRTYKVGDPIVFGNTRRFLPVIHNNTRGVIRGIEKRDDQILFDVEVQSSFGASYGADLRWVSNPTADTTLVRINVFRGDDDADDENSSGMNKTVVPLQIAYAVSIHKAQGLEYESVRLVIPNEVDDFITRDIFYTGISRAKKSLKVFWSPETQKRIVERFSDQGQHTVKMDKELGRLRQLAGRNGIRL